MPFDLDDFRLAVFNLSRSDQQRLQTELSNRLPLEARRDHVSFEKVLSPQEVNGTYLNFRDEQDRLRGDEIGLPLYSKITIATAGAKYPSTIHRPSMMRLPTRWVREHKIKAGTRIRLTYDSDDTCENRPVFCLTILDR